MAEEIIGNVRYLSLKDVSRILNKKEAALRARIKRGNLEAIQRPLMSGKHGSKRFRYMIPLEAVRTELTEMIRENSILQRPLEEGEEPNLYQILCAILSKHREGLQLSQIRWQLERYYGLSLSESSVREFLSAFPEFEERGGVYRLLQPITYEPLPAPSSEEGSASERSASSTDAQRKLREFESRINALESKIELLIQLLSTKLT